MHDAAEAIAAQRSDEDLKNLASLARFVAYARENAKELNAEFTAYCLDLALGALLQDLDRSGVFLSLKNGHDRSEPGTRH